jgi:hypothetical protein
MKIKKHVVCLIGLLLSLNSFPMINGGLIFSGHDTLDIPREKGFDFVTQTACTSYFNNSCILHFDLQFYPPSLKYTIFVQNGYSINKGKINLDSIKTAPNDSLFVGMLEVDSIPPDSLSSRIGNVYILKTGTDPRPVWNQPFYAKIKILKFIVVDSTQHQIKMVFLWAFNRSGFKDLTTSGLDTFHLDTTVVMPGGNSYAGHIHQNSFLGQSVFKVVGGVFAMPEELVGTGAYLSVYDLRGKKLRMFKAENERVVDIRKTSDRSGIIIIKVDK